MKNPSNLLTLLLMLFLSAISYAQSKPPVPKSVPKAVPTVQEMAESGIIEGNVYKNKSLGLSIVIPESWVLLSDDANKILLDASKKIISANKTEKRKQQINVSISNTRILFQALPFPMGSLDNSALIGCGVEKVPGTLNPKTYAEQNKKFILETKKLKKDLYTQVIGGATFNAFEVEWEENGSTFNQTYFITSRKGAAFFFVLTYSDDTYKKTVSDTLQTLIFEK